MRAAAGSDPLSAAARQHRYVRQVAMADLGPHGQQALRSARALVVGVGGLGSWTAELLARAGVGFLRLVDSDRVEIANVHRQGLYDEYDAAAGSWKVEAAAERLARINRETRTEPVPRRLDRLSVEAMAGDVELILDGTDNFATRFLLNDFAVKHRIPWIFAGVVAGEAQIMPVLPGQTACLRCILPTLPPSCSDLNCRTEGVLGPAVTAAAAFQASEAIKILSRRPHAVSPYLLKFDVWNNLMQRLDVSAPPGKGECACCGKREFEYLEP